MLIIYLAFFPNQRSSSQSVEAYTVLSLSPSLGTADDTLWADYEQQPLFSPNLRRVIYSLRLSRAWASGENRYISFRVWVRYSRRKRTSFVLARCCGAYRYVCAWPAAAVAAATLLPSPSLFCGFFAGRLAGCCLWCVFMCLTVWVRRVLPFLDGKNSRVAGKAVAAADTHLGSRPPVVARRRPRRLCGFSVFRCACARCCFSGTRDSPLAINLLYLYIINCRGDFRCYGEMRLFSQRCCCLFTGACFGIVAVLC